MKPKRLQPEDKQKVLEALIRFYDTRPDEYGLMERSQSVYDNYAKFINEKLPDKDIKILDYGCGSWRIPESIAKYDFKEVVGLDYFSDAKMSEYKNHLTCSNAGLATYTKPGIIPFDDNTFDVVTSLCVLEHIIDIEDSLNEIDRVLKPGGYFIAEFPNWSSILISLSAIKINLVNKDRLWQLSNLSDSILYFFRSFKWYFEVLFSKKSKFIEIEPRMKNGEIDFERSDDDVVHVCQPLSFKKYFKKKGYEIIEFNKSSATTKFTKIFNSIFPNMASGNKFIVKKIF